MSLHCHTCVHTYYSKCRKQISFFFHFPHAFFHYEFLNYFLINFYNHIDHTGVSYISDQVLDISDCFGTFWGTLGPFWMLWDLFGHNRTFWVVLGGFGRFWDSQYSFDRTFRISKNLGGPRQPSSINHRPSSMIHHPSSIMFLYPKVF